MTIQQTFLFPDMEAYETQPLKGRIVCILGSFVQPAKELTKRLTQMGAECKMGTKVSRNVHYVLVGNDAPADQLEYLHTLAFHGYHPRVLDQQGVDRLMEGHIASLMVDTEIRKDLHLTWEHYMQCCMKLEAGRNNLYTKELFVAADVMERTPGLSIALGNRGIYANTYIDDSTDVLVMGNDTLQKLKEGISDDTLHAIEQTYNQSHAQSFRYVLLAEAELKEWLDVPLSALD